jgi:hypothetical protein
VEKKKTLLEILRGLPEFDLDQECDGVIVATINGVDEDTTNLKVRGRGRLSTREALQIVSSVLTSVNIDFPNVDSNFQIFTMKKLLGALNEAYNELQQMVEKEFDKKKEKEEVVVKQEGGKHDA